MTNGYTLSQKTNEVWIKKDDVHSENDAKDEKRAAHPLRHISVVGPIGYFRLKLTQPIFFRAERWEATLAWMFFKVFELRGQTIHLVESFPL